MEPNNENINVMTKSLSYNHATESYIKSPSYVIIKHVDETGELETHLNHRVEEKATAPTVAVNSPPLQAPRVELVQPGL
jgi:hypothetical protein